MSKEFVGRGGQTVAALSPITVRIALREFVAILGPSGCGKTTLLRLFAGLERPDAGVVTCLGRPVTKPPADVALMFQTAVLLPWRTVLDNVLLPAETARLRKKEWVGRARDLLEMSGLGEFAGSYPRELSGGMRQRAALCRALLLDPPLLLMDEPFGALDALTRATMNREVHEMWTTTHKTIVFVTHDIAEAARLATRVIVMSPRPGRIVADIPLGFAGMPYSERLAAKEYADVVQQLEATVEAGAQ